MSASAATTLRHDARPATGLLRRAGTRHHALVVAAEELLVPSDGAPGQPVYVACRWLRVSERTLRNAFLGVHGRTPTRYALECRLARVRAELLAAPEKPSAVKQAALAHGFHHLGRFPQAYRDRFGELPSETVARGRCLASASVGSLG
jgi:AraC family ethanolamine operon transcriptional activator